MRSGLWGRAKPIFHAAVELEASARAAYLTECCRDAPEVRCEVERLLSLHDSSRSFFDQSESETSPLDHWKAPPTLRDAEVLSGRFRIDRLLGRGGMGEVYEAWDYELNERIALKTLLVPDGSSLYRLKNEFRAIAQIHHSNIISLYELFVQDDQPYFTMELVLGLSPSEYLAADWRTTTVSDRSMRNHATPAVSASAAADGQTVNFLTARRPLVDHAKALDILLQLAEGLRAIHAAGKLHRDIKPTNILVTPTGQLKILDFGLATALSPVESGKSMQFVGTPRYASPEQLALEPLGPKSDWYSYGTTAFYLLTGTLPFDGSFDQVTRTKRAFDGPSPAALVPGIPTDLDRLCVHLLRRAPESRPTGNQVLKILKRLSPNTVTTSSSNPSRPGASPFVGRQEDIAILRQSFEAMQGGHGSQLYIYGKSGVGKTRLIRTFLGKLPDPSAVVLTGRCFERESVPYKALDGVVDSLARYLLSLSPAESEALMPRHVHTLAKVFPVLLQVPAVHSARHPIQIDDGISLRRYAFSALRDLLGRLSDRKPVVVYIDDLQWADSDSATLLQSLVAPPDEPKLLLIASFRSEDIESKPSLQGLVRVRTNSHGTSLRLGPLNESEIHTLVRSLVAYEGLDIQDTHAGNLAAIIARESDGNPFLVEKLVSWGTSRGRTLGTGVRFNEILAEGFRDLDEKALALLRVVALFGGPLDARVACLAADIQDGFQIVANSLESGGFLRSSGAHLEIYHDKLREHIREFTAPETRRVVHEKLAESIRVIAPSDSEPLFEQYLAAGDNCNAQRYAELSAQRAESALAFDRAVHFYRNALALCPVESARYQELRIAVAEAYTNAGRPAEAARVFIEVAGESEPNKALEYRRRAAEQLLMGGHIDDGLQMTDQVLRSVNLRLVKGPRKALASLILRRTLLRVRGINYRGSPPNAIAEREIARIDICWVVAAGLALVDNVRAADFQTRQLLLSLKVGDPYRITRALAVEAGFIAARGKRASGRAAQLLDVATEQATRLQDPYLNGLTALIKGIISFLGGRWLDAISACEQAEAILVQQCHGATWELTNARTFLMAALLYTGHISSLTERIHLLMGEAQDRGNLYALTEMKTRLNIVWLFSDEPERAGHEVETALREWSHEGFHKQHFSAMRALAERDLYLDRAEDAWRRVTASWAHLKRSMLLRIQSIKIEALFLRGRCALALTGQGGVNGRSALRAARKALDEISSEQLRWADPLAMVLEAGIAAQERSEEQMVSLLFAADNAFLEADMKLYSSAVRFQLGRIAPTSDHMRRMAEAEAWMKSEGIVRPDKIAAVLVPMPIPHENEGWIAGERSTMSDERVNTASCLWLE